MTIIEKVAMPDLKDSEEMVVVIDVIRAFTTAAFVFSNKAEKIVLVKDVEEAFELKRGHPDWLLMGEMNGQIPPGFDLGNSPLEVFRASLDGKTLVQRTSCGTQGVWKASNASRMFVASFVVAEATFRKITEIQPITTTLFITAPAPGGDEDWAFTEYLEEKLRFGKADSRSYLERVRNSPSGLSFISADFPPEDLYHSQKIKS